MCGIHSTVPVAVMHGDLLGGMSRLQYCFSSFVALIDITTAAHHFKDAWSVMLCKYESIS